MCTTKGFELDEKALRHKVATESHIFSIDGTHVTCTIKLKSGTEICAIVRVQGIVESELSRHIAQTQASDQAYKKLMSFEEYHQRETAYEATS